MPLGTYLIMSFDGYQIGDVDIHNMEDIGTIDSLEPYYKSFYTVEDKMKRFERFMSNKPIEVDQQIPEMVKRLIKDNFYKTEFSITWVDEVTPSGIFVDFLDLK